MQMSDPDRPDVEALQQGDESALNRLMDRHGASLLAFVTRMIGSTADAEEIAQETFVRAYFQIHTYRPKAPFVSWLYQIARNLCRDYFRSRAYRQSLASDSMERISMDLMQAEKISPALAARIEALQVAILRLPAKFRECLILTAIEGFSHAEAGARLGLTAKAVEVRAHRARTMLAKILKEF